MRRTAFALAAFALLAPRAADAGLYLGLRAGAAWPSGDVSDTDGALSSRVDFAVPFQGDAGWQFRNGPLVALYLRAGPAELDERIRDVCDALDLEDEDCAAADLGLGLQGLWSFTPGAQLQPWLGGFVGWDVLAYSAGEDGRETDFAFSGWELGVQGGLDYDLAPFTVGPYVQVGWSQFTDRTIDPAGSVKFEDDIDGRAWHLWTTVGAKFGVTFK